MAAEFESGELRWCTTGEQMNEVLDARVGKDVMLSFVRDGTTLLRRRLCVNDQSAQSAHLHVDAQHVARPLRP